MWLESSECSLFYFYAIETRVNSHISTVHKLTALSLWWWSRCSFFFNKISLSNSSQVARLHHLFLFRSARQHADLVSCRCCDEGWQKSPQLCFLHPFTFFQPPPSHHLFSISIVFTEKLPSSYRIPVYTFARCESCFCFLFFLCCWQCDEFFVCSTCHIIRLAFEHKRESDGVAEEGAESFKRE